MGLLLLGRGGMGHQIRDKRNVGWAWIHNSIIDEYGPRMGPHGIAVYIYLARRVSNDGQECFPSYQTIANAIGSSRRKVIYTIKQLVDMKLVDIEERKPKQKTRKSNLYYLVDPPEMGGSAQDALGVVHRVHQGSAQGAPYQDSFNKTQLNKCETHNKNLVLKSLLKENPNLLSNLKTDRSNGCNICEGIGTIFVPGGGGTGYYQACECMAAKPRLNA